MAKKDKLKELKEKNKGFIGEFKEFIARGNVMDLAVGVIVGNAFSKIVTSLTDNILMPLVGVAVGGFDFSKMSYTFELFDRTVDLKYGIFIQNTVDFIITAFCIFMVVKIMNKVFKKKEEEKVEPPKPEKSNQELLLEEIRDILKDNEKK